LEKVIEALCAHKSLLAVQLNFESLALRLSLHSAFHSSIKSVIL